jgi:dihydrofolate reductase
MARHSGNVVARASMSLDGFIAAPQDGMDAPAARGRPPADGRPGVTFVSGDISGAVATARDAAGGKDLVVLGANAVAQCLRPAWSMSYRCSCCRSCLAAGRACTPPTAPLGWTSTS